MKIFTLFLEQNISGIIQVENNNSDNLVSTVVLIQIFILRVWAITITFLAPTMGLIGLFLNSLILIFMPKCKMIPVKAKINYLVIDVFDSIVLVFLHLLTAFPNSLYNLSNSQINFPFFELVSDLTCKISRFFWRTGEGYANTLALTFSCERLIVMKFLFLVEELGIKILFL